MHSSTMVNTIAENSRRYEQALRRAEKALAEANDSDLSLQSELTAALRRFAGAQLDEGFIHACRDLQPILAARKAAEKELREQLANQESAIAEEVARIQVARGEIDAIIERVRADLASQSAYAGAFERYKAAADSLQMAEQGYAEIARECEEKLPAFEQDNRYLYLRRSGFGTDVYRRRGLFRVLDRWVARQCNYLENRASEQALISMREANETRFASLTADHDEAKAVVRGMFQKALEDAGVPGLEARLEGNQDVLKAKKADASRLQRLLQAFAAKADARYQDAVKLLSDTLGRHDAGELQGMAEATQDKADDDAAREIETIQLRLNQVRASIPRLRLEVEEAEASYDRAKRLERELDDARYSSSRYMYRSGLDLQDLLTGYMAGALSQRDVVSEVDSHRERVYTPEPSYNPSPSRSGDSDIFDSFGRSGSSGSSGGFGSFSTSDSSGGGSFSTTDSL